MQRLQPCVNSCVNQNSVSVNHEQGDGHLPCEALQCLCVLVLNVLVCRSRCETCNPCARNLYM